MTNRQQFLLEHNRLAPPHLQVTQAMLARFRVEKQGLFKGKDWSVEKLRRPFVMWLTSLSVEEREEFN